MRVKTCESWGALAAIARAERPSKVPISNERRGLMARVMVPRTRSSKREQL